MRQPPVKTQSLRSRLVSGAQSASGQKCIRARIEFIFIDDDLDGFSGPRLVVVAAALRLDLVRFGWAWGMGYGGTIYANLPTVFKCFDRKCFNPAATLHKSCGCARFRERDWLLGAESSLSRRREIDVRISICVFNARGSHIAQEIRMVNSSIPQKSIWLKLANAHSPATPPFGRIGGPLSKLHSLQFAEARKNHCIYLINRRDVLTRKYVNNFVAERLGSHRNPRNAHRPIA